ncbi:hypothetical protein HanXRQr2_Chr15g0691621 [Helianthus annuus]|uniref:Uncharacterized protein n=1 Tax=Helianthus annuus TaxID=4232 RepID=A0A9K3DZI9_HELAN|nr:hypothetical protein HanXRQr2_Chr15g0691621 [Helianthus annuus]
MTLVLAMKFKTRLLWRSSVRNGAEPCFTIMGLQAGGFFPGTSGSGMHPLQL